MIKENELKIGDKVKLDTCLATGIFKRKRWTVVEIDKMIKLETSFNKRYITIVLPKEYIKKA